MNYIEFRTYLITYLLVFFLIKMTYSFLKNLIEMFPRRYMVNFLKVGGCSEAFNWEFLEYLEDMFPRYYKHNGRFDRFTIVFTYSVAKELILYLEDSIPQLHSDVLPVARKNINIKKQTYSQDFLEFLTSPLQIFLKSWSNIFLTLHT